MPSFCHRGVDRVTFRLFPADHLQLVFDRGAKPQDSEGFAAEEAAIVALVNRWVAV